MSEGEYLELPRPKKGGWLVMALVGVMLLVASLPDLLSDVDAAGVGAFVIAGVGLFLLGFATLLLSNRQHAVALVLHEHAIELQDNQRGSVEIPYDVLDRAGCYSDQNRRTVLALFKKDGGVLELGVVGGGEFGEQLTESIADALRRAQRGWEEREPGHEARLELRHVTDKRGRSSRELSWRPGWPLTMLLPMLAPFVGMALIALGVHREEPSIATMVFSGFTLTLLLLVVVSWLNNVGATQYVTIDNEMVRCERRRILRSPKTDEIPLEHVATVDYAHHLNTNGANLTLCRTDDQGGLDAARIATEYNHPRNTRKIGAAVEKSASVGDGVRTFAALLAHLGKGVQLPLGKLPLSEKIALDLILSAEIAERSGRRAGQL